MKRNLLAVVLLLFVAGLANAKGMLIPEDKKLPPLAMLNHKVEVAIEDQVAITKVEQTFRNHTNRQLEATYMFPVPRGASVREFAMWVNGKKVSGELLDAAKAKQIYTDIVRRTQDPGLLEYIGSDLLQMKVFPIPPNADQKVEMSFTSMARRDQEVVEYIYPLKTDGKATATLEEFSLKIALKSQHPIVNIYSPTHAIGIRRINDKEAAIEFEKAQALLDKDFQLFYTTGDKDVGLTVLGHRPLSSEDGFFMLLMSPKVEMSEKTAIPRDMVLVLDTSGSMAGIKMEQAKKALKLCLDSLRTQDRFAVINFSTTVNKYRDGLVDANSEQLDHAKKWCDKLVARGGTAINAALLEALAMRSSDEGRSFNIVFFTDGQPTIGETDTNKILKNVMAKNTANTRIFTFGVGEADGIDAAFLDQLAEQTRAVSTFVKPAEDIGVKTASLVKKISHPVLANLKLSVVGDKVTLNEIYPPQLPDLFHGGQVTVLGRYTGNGPVAIKLTGQVGKETKEFVYEVTFAPKTNDDRSFVEDLWARRKVGYLLDQIRQNGEKKELVDEVKSLAKKYGITTPYTSFLIVPDAPLPVAGRSGGAPVVLPAMAADPAALKQSNGKVQNVAEFARNIQTTGLAPGLGGGIAVNRGAWADNEFKKLPGEGKPMDDKAQQLLQAKTVKDANDQAFYNIRNGQAHLNRIESQGVNLSCYTNDLKNQCRLQQTALRRVGSRNCVEIGGVWIDEGYTAKTPTVTVKAQSDAYFRILEKRPEVKEVFQLGNHLVWVTPNGTALVVDTNDGKDKMDDAEIDTLFVKK